VVTESKRRNICSEVKKTCYYYYYYHYYYFELLQNLWENSSRCLRAGCRSVSQPTLKETLSTASCPSLIHHSTSNVTMPITTSITRPYLISQVMFHSIQQLSIGGLCFTTAPNSVVHVSTFTMYSQVICSQLLHTLVHNSTQISPWTVFSRWSSWRHYDMIYDM